MNDFLRLGGDRVRRVLDRYKYLSEKMDSLSKPEQILNEEYDDIPAECTRVIWNTSRGPAKGGIRIVPVKNTEALFSLSLRILLKCSANDLPHGGAAGEIVFDKGNSTDSQLEVVVRRFMAMNHSNLQQQKDIISPDLGFGEPEIRMAYDYLKMHTDIPAYHINGKPMDLGGLPGRKDATGVGASDMLHYLSTNMGFNFGARSYSIQGFGHAGQGLATELTKLGWKCLSASDSSSVLYRPDGLDVQRLRDFKTEGGSFVDWVEVGTSIVSYDDQFSIPVDVFIPAYSANQITVERARKMKCSLVLEIANGPVASSAEGVLTERGINIIPDLIANSGGIIASHLEWANGKSADTLIQTIESTNGSVKKRMHCVADRLLKKVDDTGMSLVDATYNLALENI